MGSQHRAHYLDSAHQHQLHDLAHHIENLVRLRSSVIVQYVLVCLFWGLVLYALATVVPA